MTRTLPDTTSKPALLAWAKDPARGPAELAAATGFFPEVDRAIATRVDCPPGVLATLSHSSDKATRAKVTANANTPAWDYVRLGQQFPKEFIANPLLDLLLLENPALLNEVPTALLVQISKKPECPAGFLIWASSHPDKKVQLSVAMNAKAPAEALERLRESAHPSVRESVSSAASGLAADPEMLFREAVRERLAALTPEEVQEAWAKRYIGVPQFRELSLIARLQVADAENHVMPLAGAVAANPNLPVLLSVQLLELLAQFGDPSVRASVAQNPNTPVAVLKALTKVSSARDSVAGNPNTPVALLNALAKDKKWTIRRSVAKKPNTPAALLEALAKDEDSSVRSSVAENPSTPVALLEALAKDKEWYVRSSVAKNPNTPVALLEPLAKDKDKDAYVRSSVAENSNTPVALLKALAKDKGWDVRLYVARNPNTSVAVLEALAKDESVYESRFVRCSVAGNPSTPVASLAALAKDNDYDVRVSVAENPNSPAALLEALAKDEYYTVRIAVASNPNTPETAMMQLASDCMTDRRHSTYPVRERLASNPAATPAVLEKMYADIVGFARLLEDEPLRVPAIAEQRARSDENIRSALDTGNFLFTPNKDPNGAVLSRNPIAVLMALCSGAFVEPARIARISGSTDWLVRAAVARNPGTPPNLVKKLGADAHPLVRALVSARSKPPNIDGAVPGTHA